jgi:RNA polymerase primary sigma factor
MNIDKSLLDLKKNPECEHIGLVFDICHRFHRVHKLKGLDFDDLVIIGYMALKRAWDGYKEEEGKPFAAYAGQVIRDWLRKSINNQCELHIPDYINFQGWRVEDGQGVSESFEAKAEASTFDCLKRAIQTRRMKRRGFELATHIAKNLDRSDNVNVKDELTFALRFVNARAHEVISLRYGLTGGDPKTLDEVSRLLNVTRQRIQQIENEALEKMRAALIKSKERMDNA